MVEWAKEHTGALHGKYGDKGHAGCPGCMTEGMHLAGTCTIAYSYGPHLIRLCPYPDPSKAHAFDAAMRRDTGS
jgi:hypothetical protein